MEPSPEPTPGDYANAILCPACPHCGSLPVLELLGLYQWFCPNMACDVFCWVPYVSAADNLADEHRMVIQDAQEPDPGPA